MLGVVPGWPGVPELPRLGTVAGCAGAPRLPMLGTVTGGGGHTLDGEAAWASSSAAKATEVKGMETESGNRDASGV
jgi:hypothetical protein